MSSRVLDALASVIDPEIRKPITELDMVGAITENGDGVEVEIKLTIVGCPMAQKIERDVKAALQKSFTEVKVNLNTMTEAERNALKQKLRGGKPLKFNQFAEDSLTNVLLIGSGKGGVGKSTLTANLAVALAAKGFQVGVLDADIYGYSIPAQLGITLKPTKVDELIMPVVAHDVKVISIGMFVDDNAPIAWRGPMLHRAMEQFLSDVYWGALDFLLVDLPPGTGDIAISLGQLLPAANSIVVTTPQQVAALVAERSGAISLQAGQKLLGVIENLSYLDTPDGRTIPFGSGGGAATAKKLSEIAGYEVELLGQIPIDEKLASDTDNGTPTVISSPNSPASRAILAIANKLARQPKGLVGKPLGLKPV